MPAKKAKPASAKDKKDKKPSRPTRCGPDFEWKAQPKLVVAAEKNDIDRVERLLVRGEDPNEALHYAVGRGRLHVTEMLLKAGASLHTDIKDGDYWVSPPVPPSEVRWKESSREREMREGGGGMEEVLGQGGGDRESKGRLRKGTSQACLSA